MTIQRRIRILLVEDNPGDAVLIQTCLPRDGETAFDVTTVAYLHMAMSELKEKVFDIVLLDLSLPDSQGMSTFTRLHEFDPNIPVVVVTGLLGEDIGTQAVRSGAQDYLIKGRVDGDLLVRSILYAIERKKIKSRQEAMNSLLELFARCTTCKEYLDSVVSLIQRCCGSRCAGIQLTDGSVSGRVEAERSMAVKIFHQDRVLGVLYLENEGGGAFEQETTELVETMAPVIGEAIYRFNVESSLQKSNELLEQMFSGIHVLTAYMDKDFNFIRVNRAYAEADGKEEAYFIGKNHFQLYPNPENEAIFRQVVTTGEPYIVFGKPFIYASNPERGITYWDWSLQPVRDMNGIVIGVVLSLLNVTEQKRLEKEILEISRREQERIGQDLHDVLGQNLTGLAFLAKALEHKLKEKLPAESKDANSIAKLASQAVNQARALARGMCPVELKAEGLITALEEFASNMQDYFGIRCRFQYECPVLIPENSTATHLYRIVQESVNNAIKHGKATDILIALHRQEGKIRLSIQDNGVGLPENLKKESKGMGLRIMQYRAHIIGGTLEVSRRERGGTLIECVLDDMMVGKAEGYYGKLRSSAQNLNEI